MANLVDKLEEQIKKFMNNHRKIEDKVKKDIENILISNEKKIETYFKSMNGVSVGTINSTINNQIRPIIENQKQEMQDAIDNAIRNQYEVGIDNGERMLSMTNEQTKPLDKSEIRNEEVLAALLLFGRTLVNGFNEDLINDLNRNLTNMYIETKNKNNHLGGNTTVTTILSGVIISKYIISTFQKYKKRAETIVQTEVVRALNHGHLNRYIKSIDEINSLKVKWVYIPDNKVCSPCKQHGESGSYGNGIYDMGEISPPPLHPRCRCILIPFKYSWLEIAV